MTDSLAAKTCTPCQGGIPPLDFDAARDLVSHESPGWSLLDDGHRIERRFTFKDYQQAFEFVARISALAEEEGHHPDVSFGWGYATISLQTKKIMGLHENDIIMAAKIDRLPGAGG